MSDLCNSRDEPVEQWLDEWEELRDRQPDLAIEEFLARHCAAAPRHVIEQLHRRLRGLDAIDRVIGQIVDDMPAEDSPARPP